MRRRKKTEKKKMKTNKCKQRQQSQHHHYQSIALCFFFHDIRKIKGTIFTYQWNHGFYFLYAFVFLFCLWK